LRALDGFDQIPAQADRRTGVGVSRLSTQTGLINWPFYALLCAPHKLCGRHNLAKLTDVSLGREAAFDSTWPINRRFYALLAHYEKRTRVPGQNMTFATCTAQHASLLSRQFPRDSV
jgi:hypothetical protein